MIIYSTDPDFKYDDPESGPETPAPAKQDLRVWLDRKMKGGKQATVIRGFVGDEDDLKELARELKTRLGVGGTAKEGEIIIQGDFRDRVVDLLQKADYRAKKAGG